MYSRSCSSHSSPSFKAASMATELKEFMIRKAGLGLNPGSDFTRALSGFMRLNAACPRATLEKALGQLERAVNELAH